MKKSIIALIALAGISTAATELTYWAENNNKDLCTIDGGKLPYLGQGNSRASADVLTSIQTVGNTDYSLNFKDENKEAVSFIVNDALYFNQIYTTGSVTSYTITFGANGSMTAADDYDIWGGAIRFTQGATVTLKVGVSDEQLANTASGEVFSRAIISSTDTTENALWNVTDKLTVTAQGLNGYLNVGLVENINRLKEGEYGYMKILSGDENDGGADGIAFVFRAIPEPTTATLSLLALAGLAARRRRR